MRCHWSDQSASQLGTSARLSGLPCVQRRPCPCIGRRCQPVQCKKSSHSKQGGRRHPKPEKATTQRKQELSVEVAEPEPEEKTAIPVAEVEVISQPSSEAAPTQREALSPDAVLSEEELRRRAALRRVQAAAAKEKGYIEGVLEEVQLIEWPKVQEAVRDTILVILIVAAFAVYLFAVNTTLSEGFRRLYEVTRPLRQPPS